MLKKRYFNLNIKHPHWDRDTSAAEHWLGQSRAPVFFGFDSVEDVMAGVIETPLNPRQTNEMLEFLRVSENAASEKFDPIIATIDRKSVV